MEDNELINSLINMFMQIKSKPFHNMAECEGLTHNEKLVLFLIHDMANNNKISLSELRKKINLAPSTVTPIITSLEKKGLIERNIDKTDRRNIFLELSSEGIQYTNIAHDKMINSIKEYVMYMGKEDTKQLIRLLTKTANFMDERRKK